MIVCATYLDGEYGVKDITIGVPVIIGKNGIERIVELDLNKDEKEKFAASEAATRKTNDILTEMKLTAIHLCTSTIIRMKKHISIQAVVK